MIFLRINKKSVTQILLAILDRLFQPRNTIFAPSYELFKIQFLVRKTVARSDLQIR